MSSRVKKPAKLVKRRSSDSMKRSRKSYDHEETSSQRSSGANSDADMQGITGIGIVEFLELDPRPTFVLRPDTHCQDGFDPVFRNRAFRSNHQLSRTLTPSTNNSSPPSPKLSMIDFERWMKAACQSETDESSDLPTFLFLSHVWTPVRLRQRYIVISGTLTIVSGSLPLRVENSTPSSKYLSEMPKETRLLRVQSAPVANYVEIPLTVQSFTTPGSTDWTVASPEGDLSPHIIFARSIDWAATPLGDMTTWSREFRQVVNLLMRHPQTAAIFWGDELTVMYNKQYSDSIAGHKHPQLMGTGFRGPFAELWDTVGETFIECQQNGKSVLMKDQMLPIERHGFLEETFFTWSLTPLYGGTSQLLGFFNAPFETTRQTINDRRTRTLLKMSEEVALAQSVKHYWPRILSALAENEWDFPFAILYSMVDDETDDGSSISSESTSSHAMKSCVLEGALGVPEGHLCAPIKLDLKRSMGGFIPAFRDAMKTREPKLLNIMDGTLSESLIEGLEWRGFGDPCKFAVVCPIRPTTSENVLGFLVIGINPRRPYDKDYESFITLLNRQLATSLASATLFEDEIRRGQSAAEAAALERSRLSEELAVSRGRLQRMAEVSPVGMFSIDPRGLLLEANDRWFEITGHPRDTAYELSWMGVISDGSVAIAEQGWHRLTADKLPWSSELQLNNVWYDPITGEQNDHWVLAAAQPEFSEDGNVRIVIGSITDITLQKRSEKDAETRAQLSEQLLLRTQETEALQKQRLEEAEETRRQQNSFIDITSHEMRNPLSAIVQCADSISISMNEISISAHQAIDAKLKALVKGSIDAAATIQFCALHMKSIVDDILTISKLDSNLLLITPVPISPVQVLQQALKMFVAECKLNTIKLETHIEPSMEDLKVDMVMLDPSRLLQVLINLLTNAVKFTKSEKERKIEVFLGAFLEPPANNGAKLFQYFPTNRVRTLPDVTSGEDWGTGEILYLRWEVRDTGCGLDESEKRNLFTKFSQASPRTHVQYGGSGLGLFISRQLTELQGGEIGVASVAGVGSTFAFYLKVRRSDSESVPGPVNAAVENDLDAKLGRATDSQEASLANRLAVLKPSPSLIILPEVATQDWHVLIVEDNLVNQRILAAQISKLGCTTHVANHGGEALKLLKKTKYYRGKERDGIELSIILMDLEMPVMDGLTCALKIREMEAEGLIQGRIPIIAVTANARGEQIVAAKDSGMDDVMPKPFRIKQLIPKIEALLQKTATQ